MNDNQNEDRGSLVPEPESDERDKVMRLTLLAKRITEARKRRGLSLEALACRVGISKGNLSDIENLKRNPRYTTLVAIADGLDLTISELLDGI